MKKILSFLLATGLLIAEAWAVEKTPIAPATSASQAPMAAVQAQPGTTAQAEPAASGQETTPTQTQPQRTTAQRRSYERETGRHHHGISKKEWIFLGAIAGTSMGIGAIAAGAHGLAIGAIAGGWGAFAGHFIWHKLH
jgi:hypothetical protein